MAVTKARQSLTPARVIGWTLLALLAAFLLIQLVPYGRAHAAPAVTGEPAWPAGARQLAVRACFDCHSNQTVWPWYSNIAPVSWLVQHDVDEGRHWLNFSQWNQGGFGGEA
ncbi:MAG TPA: heme-binding domain-containing protein, partial [Deinococcales bacterium]|nr:heme-binding domain-containing protein [Deinococcales bacterium]